MLATLQQPTLVDTSEDVKKLAAEEATKAARVAKLQQEASQLSECLSIINSKLEVAQANLASSAARKKEVEKAQEAFTFPFSLQVVALL